jgi:hypothetical protein
VDKSSSINHSTYKPQTADLQAQINAMGSRTAAYLAQCKNIYDQTWQFTNLDVASYRDGRYQRFLVSEDGSG